MKVLPVDQIQLIGLQWAKLARSVLCGGLCLIFKDEISKDDTTHTVQNWGYKNWSIAFATLFGMYSFSYVSLHLFIVLI
jgi:hypothetical protein